MSTYDVPNNVSYVIKAWQPLYKLLFSFLQQNGNYQLHTIYSSSHTLVCTYTTCWARWKTECQILPSMSLSRKLGRDQVPHWCCGSKDPTSRCSDLPPINGTSRIWTQVWLTSKITLFAFSHWAPRGKTFNENVLILIWSLRLVYKLIKRAKKFTLEFYEIEIKTELINSH